MMENFQKSVDSFPSKSSSIDAGFWKSAIVFAARFTSRPVSLLIAQSEYNWR